MGIVTEANNKALRENKRIFKEKGIETCEVCHILLALGHDTGANCWIGNGLSFAHKNKRRWYRSQLEKLYDFNQVVLACPVAHTYIENKPEVTKLVFERLRGA